MLFNNSSGKSTLQIESYRRGIVLSSGFNAIAKCLAFVTNVAIAYYFGTQVKTDVYFYCIGTVMLMTTFLANLNTSVIIPESMRLTAQEGKKASMEFVNFFFWIYLVIGIIVTCILTIKPVSVFTAISQFDIENLQSNSNIVLFSAPLFILILLSLYLVEVLKSYKFFTIPMIASMLNNIISLVFLFCFHNKLGILSLLVGLIASYILQLFFLVCLMVRVLKWRFAFKVVKVGSKNVKNIFYSLTGEITTTLAVFVPAYLLSGFGLGIISALNYGQRVANLPDLLITGQFSSVAGIKFNELYSRKELKQLNNIFVSSAKTLIFILVPASFIIFICSNEIVTVLFKRGAFNENSVKLSALFLKYLALLLPMLAVNTLIARLFMAGQKLKQGFWFQILLNITLITIMYFAVKSIGVIGYPLSLLCVHAFNVLIAYFFLRWLFPTIQYKEVLIYLAKIILLNVIVFFMVYLLRTTLCEINLFLNVTIVTAVYISGLLILSCLFGINLTSYVGYFRSITKG
jgi:peptidoglycan biosynthesis protein MviN/MurJ (putative lipid II flippase)